MDWSLWDTSYDQVGQESSSFMGQGQQPDFYSDYGIDVIEESALNEKSCIQVLRILITKADTEIVELEEDLIILQSQLAFAADDEWSAICTATLREKVNCLDISIQNLKNENVQYLPDFGVCSPIHKELAERLYELLKTMLRNYFQLKNEQLVTTIQSSSLNTEKLAIDHSNGERNLSNSSLKIDSDEVTGESSIPTASILDLPERKITNKAEKDEVKAAFSSLLCQKIDVGETYKCGDTIIKDSCSNALGHATANPSEKKELSKFDLKVNQKEEFKKHKTTPADTNKISNSSLKLARKRTNFPKTARPESAAASDSNSDASRHATGPLGKNKLSRTDSKINRGKGVNYQSSMNKSIVIKSSLEPGGKGTNISETIEPAFPILDTSLDKITEDSNVKRKLKFLQTDKIDSSNPSLQAQKKRVKTPNTVKGPKAGLTDNKHTAADSLLDLLEQGRKDTTDPWAKKVQKPQSKQVQNVELASTEDMSKSNLSPEPQRHRRKTKLQSNPVGVQKPGFSPVEIVEIGSDSSSPEKRKLQSNPVGVQKPGFSPVEIGSDSSSPEKIKELKGLQISLAELHVQNVELASTDDMSRSNLPLEPQRHRKKRKLQSNPVGVQEPGFSPVEIGSDSSSIRKTEGQQKSRMADSNANFIQSVNRETKEEESKRRKKSSNSPSPAKIKELKGLEITLAELHGKTTQYK